MNATPDQCAAELLETVPQLMRVIRTNVRAQRGSELSMPQFRALAFLGRNEGGMLSGVATFLGLTLPAASKLVDGLVEAGLASRETHARDRRRVSLALTGTGKKRYASVVAASRNFLAGKMRRLNAADRDTVLRALQLLDESFADAPDEERNHPAVP